MKFTEATNQLQKALKDQKTINTKKLKEILICMNVSFKGSPQHNRDVHVDYLKGEIKKRNQESEAYRIKVSNQKKEIKRLQELLNQVTT